MRVKKTKMNPLVETVHQIGYMVLNICCDFSTDDLSMIFQASVSRRHIISVVVLRRETNQMTGQVQPYLVF